VLLIIEVADSSLEYDRDVKIPQYAGAGIGEAWLVDLNTDHITVYRGPGRDGYRDVVTKKRGETIRPSQLTLEITADEILG